MGRQLACPADFTPDARELFSVAQKQLRAQGTWTRADYPLLEMYVRNLMAARQARKDAENLKYGNSLEMRAALKQANDHESAALALAKALLLTAAARKSAGVKAPQGIDDELAALAA